MWSAPALRRLCSREVLPVRRSGQLPSRRTVNCGAERLLRRKVGRLLLWCRLVRGTGVDKVPVEMGVRLSVFSSRAPVVMTVLSAAVGSNSLLRAAFSLLHPRCASVLITRLGVCARLRLRLGGASSAMEMTIGEMFIVRLRPGNLSAAVIAQLLSLATRVKHGVSLSGRQRIVMRL